MNDFYKRFGLRRVINARGPATVLGASRVNEKVRKDIEQALGMSVEIWELQRRASEAISRLTGAEAGCVVGCSAAGIAISAAATITGDNIAKIKELPTITGEKNKIVVQKGHVIGIGDTPLNQVLRLTGAEVVEVGEALDCATFYLVSSLTSDVAAAVYVLGDVFPPNLLPLETFIKICKSKNIPVIVDAAYETDFTHLIKKGADLVVHSAQKWLGGATAAIIAGRKDLVHACYLQEMGIGRPMKVGKEGIVGVISAIESWINRDHKGILKRQMKMAERFKAKVSEVNGLRATIKRSEYSPSIRVEMTVDQEKTGMEAWEINYRLGKGDPVIKMDDYAVHHGKMTFDLTFLDDGDELTIIDSIVKILENKKKDTFHPKAPIKPLTRMDLLYETAKKWLDEDPRDESVIKGD